jgi:hypothetical protein
MVNLDFTNAFAAINYTIVGLFEIDEANLKTLINAMIV